MSEVDLGGRAHLVHLVPDKDTRALGQRLEVLGPTELDLVKASWVSVEDDPDGARPKAKDAGSNMGKDLGKAGV